jgi:hypothetical protein
LALPRELLRAPTTVEEAKWWVEKIVGYVGPRFYPNETFASYDAVRWSGEALDLHRGSETVRALNRALAAAKELLGEWIYDLRYRCVLVGLDDLDPDWHLWARPPIMPPARWWLMEYLDPAHEDDRGPHLVHQDADDGWWRYDRATGRLHLTP